MEKLKHWTSRGVANFVHSIASDFVAQIETKMEEKGMERKELATKARVSPGRVSQVLNDPSGLNLRSMVKYARAVNMKVAVVAYDDGDARNEKGPVSAGVFVAAWQNAGCPRDLFELQGIPNGNVLNIGILQAPYHPNETVPKIICTEEDAEPKSPIQTISGAVQQLVVEQSIKQRMAYAQRPE